MQNCSTFGLIRSAIGASHARARECRHHGVEKAKHGLISWYQTILTPPTMHSKLKRDPAEIGRHAQLILTERTAHDAIEIKTLKGVQACKINACTIFCRFKLLLCSLLSARWIGSSVTGLQRVRPGESVAQRYVTMVSRCLSIACCVLPLWRESGDSAGSLELVAPAPETARHDDGWIDGDAHSTSPACASLCSCCGRGAHRGRVDSGPDERRRLSIREQLLARPGRRTARRLQTAAPRTHS
jgi:hypothetical protein